KEHHCFAPDKLSQDAMPQRPRPARQRHDEPQQPAPPESRYRVEHYGKSRNFAAYDGKNIIAVTLYRKGAEEITARLTEKDRRIAALESQLATVRQQITTAPPAPPSAEPAPAPAWRPPEQLALIAAEDIRAYRASSPRHQHRHRTPAR